jgi:indolepyruvate ferredoxin oxidoreductase
MGEGREWPAPPLPKLPDLGGEPYGIVVTGIGGTGVVTIGALIGMAAHLEGLGVSVLDQLGMAQKNGAVTTHIRLSANQDDIHAVRIGSGNAHLLLGCDIVVAAGADAVSKLRAGHTRAVVNDHVAMTADFTHRPDLAFPAEGLKLAITDAIGREACDFVDASKLATNLLGDSLATNLFMVGFAWQKGLVPLSAASLDRAIELNGAMVDFNKQAFLWGRRAAHDLASVAALASPPETLPEDRVLSASLDQRIARRKAYLADYQDQAYAERYAKHVSKIRHLETVVVPGQQRLAEAVAQSLFRLMAVKDEFEVGRLMADPAFLKEISDQFDGPYRIKFHLAPPLLAAMDEATGRPHKSVWGGWMLGVFKLLARMKGIRNSWLDPFRYTAERRMNHKLLADYEALLDHLADRLAPANHDICVELAALAQSVRGYGPVKEKAAGEAETRKQALLARLNASLTEAA